jgi:hypothetical protein
MEENIMVVQNKVTNFLNKVEVLSLDQIGHLEKHTGQTDSDMIHRIVSEKKPVVTSFCLELDDIKTRIRAILREYADEVVDWICDQADGDDFFIYADQHELVGTGFFKEGWHEWNAGPAHCSQILLCLRKVETRNDTTFKIVSCYPYVSDEDIAEMAALKAEYRQKQLQMAI